MKKLILLSSLIVSFLAEGQSRYNIIYEAQLGQNYAAENFNSGFHLFDFMDSLLIPKQIIERDNQYAKIINPIFRFTKLFLTNYLISDYPMTMNHERFGHGYRMIEGGGAINEIVYNMPPPFTNQFSYISLDYPLNFTPQQNLMINLGGSETNLVFSDILRKNVLLDGKFSYNYSITYLYASNDAPGYTAFISNPASDHIRYREGLNNFYGGNSPLTLKKMRIYSFLSLFTDPINFYALKSIFFDYLVKGNGSADIKMIGLSERFKYLPRFRFENTPFGPELVYQNYFKLDSKLIQLNFSHSDGSFNSSWRIDTKMWNIQLGNKLSFNISGELWNQPLIDFYVDDVLHQSQYLGSKFILTTNYDIITSNHLLGLTLQMGYKTRGYSLGEQLDRGLVLRSGLTFKLGN